MKKLVSFVVLFLLSVLLFSQDTLTVLQYNLLNYGVNTSYCTSSNNNINSKDNYLRTIIGYIKPDIFTVNEMSSSPSIQLHLLDQVMNSNGVNYYEKANFISQAQSDIVNMLYYNSEKLVLKSHVIAQYYIRDVDIYQLYFLSDDLLNGDTAFVYCIVAHLKASSGTSNENKRKVMANNIMDYLNSHDNDNNYLLMGDFNLYSADEPAYQQFINYSNSTVRFYDPLDKPGDWHSNFAFSNIHTQSTHTIDNGCAASGGMDDRFDFILISNNIRKGYRMIRYLPGSFHPVGQDGNHFNKSINSSPQNTSVPSGVLNALYNNSDHLPVTMKLLVGKYVGISQQENDLEITSVNPIRDKLEINIHTKQRENITVELIDLTGRIRMKKLIFDITGQQYLNIPVDNLERGFYILRLNKGNELLLNKKIVKI
jgi:endonuclease/exonuclease/phosphatase family metal-dependent hydrolase